MLGISALCPENAANPRPFDPETEPETPGTAWALEPEELGEALDAGIVSEGVQPETEAPAEPPANPSSDVTTAGASGGHDEAEATEAAALRDRAEFLDEAARRLTIPDDPTILSYLLSGIVQVESLRRQGLLEMPTTERFSPVRGSTIVSRSSGESVVGFQTAISFVNAPSSS